ncbi:hypothetical protein TNCV_2111291 [Trichonephila clavipes]|nr:hypothetical protein TNCV_2111291 [Trichonephila clavipes]
MTYPKWWYPKTYIQSSPEAPQRWKNKYWIAKFLGSSSDRGSFRVTRLTNGREFPGRVSLRHVLGLRSAGKECDLRWERNSLHWSSSSSPIGKTGRSEEKGECSHCID